MDLLQGLQSLLGDGAQQGRPASRSMGSMGGMASGGMGGGGDLLSGLLNPNVLGGLVSALFANRGGGRGSAGGGMGALGALGGALGGAMGGGAAGGAGINAIGSLLGSLMGGGGTVFDQQTDMVNAANTGFQQFNAAAPAAAPANAGERAVRLIRALIFAAKSDGHIDADEQNMIVNQLNQLNLGSQGQAVVQQALSEPLDPNRIASGVRDGQEAIQLYALSCAVTNADTVPERRYLDALAAALRLPANVKSAIDAKFGR